MSAISLISLNVERAKHLDLVLPFLRNRDVDIVFLQELREKDIPRFSEILGHGPLYVPMSHCKEFSGESAVIGIGIFSRHPISDRVTRYYSGDASTIPTTDIADPASYTNTNRAVLLGTLEKDGQSFRVGTTHFTWSQKGEATDLQRSDIRKLLDALSQEKECILTGDFNAPRGGEIFSELATRYKDNIPLRYGTSIDATLHRAGKTAAAELADKMVDGLFSTPQYVAADVELIPGVSDHYAVVSTVQKQ